MSAQNVTLIGNLTRDIELRYTSGARPVASTGLAVGHRYQQNGEWVEKTTFFNLTIWGELGENVAASLSKGNRVVCTGRVEIREYEHQGVKRTAVDFIVDELAPSLRWARAVVDRTTRTETSTNTAAPTNSEQLVPAGAPSRPGYDPVYGDEEPF